MKGLYCSNLDPNKSKGYEAKILGQIKGFNALGIDIDLICLSSDKQIVLKQYSSIENKNINEKIIGQYSYNCILKKLALYNNTLQVIKHYRPDFLYLRHPRSDPMFVHFLKSIKRLDSKLVIISEIPTYPYDREYTDSPSIKNLVLIFLDKLNRNKLKNYIDRIVVIAYNGDVFGIPSINITNGIDTSNIKLLAKKKVLDKELNLIGVGNIDFWHGYDRVILGLKNYFHNNKDSNKYNIYLNIVSPHRETIKSLQEMTLKFNLSENILFHGEKHGEELNNLYRDCHLAIGDLGSHRKKIIQTAALKTREYAARGIPFVHSAKDIDFDSNFIYSLSFPSNDDAIDICKLIRFYESLNAIDYPIKIRNYAEKYLDWSVKLKPVIEEVLLLIKAKQKIS